MKLADIGDFVATPWRNGRVKNCSSWRIVDSCHNPNPTADDIRLHALSPLGGTARGEIREVWHYGTHMGTFRLTKQNAWEFTPISVGLGSVSDQRGMNKILANYRWRYRRNGGVARYEYLRLVW